jgi:hypothetical protein
VVAHSSQEAQNIKAFETLVRVAAAGDGHPIQPLDRWWYLAPIEPIGGRWYFGFSCPNCREFSAMFLDYSDGTLGKPFKGCGILSCCIKCSTKARCPSEFIHSAMWPLEAGAVPPVSEFAHEPPRVYTEDPEGRPVQGPLHHYTSIDALRSIVDTKTLWATNIHYMNDSSESRYGLGLMIEVGHRARALARDVDAQFLDWVIERLNGPIIEDAAVYVLCLSEAHNQLSQWRGYTQYGHGLCLSIDSNLLVERMQRYGWTFQHCRYNLASQLSWAEAILLRMRREASFGYATFGGDKTKIFADVLNNCLSSLLQVAATIKHESFYEEREVRFISPMISLADKRVFFRKGRSTQIPYVEFSLADVHEPLALTEIMIGPGPAQDATHAAIADLVYQKHLKESCSVSRSKIPYREL